MLPRLELGSNNAERNRRCNDGGYFIVLKKHVESAFPRSRLAPKAPVVHEPVNIACKHSSGLVIFFETTAP